VVIIIAVIPWRYAFAQYVMAPGDPMASQPAGTSDATS
jgi:hypothetical protein